MKVRGGYNKLKMFVPLYTVQNYVYEPFQSSYTTGYSKKYHKPQRDRESSIIK
jgi:hypothetical protein